ncbi:MAG: hypothetical protein WBQ14_06715 [Gaiellaceae bacterium]
MTAAIVAAAVSASSNASRTHQAAVPKGFNRAGDILVTDQFNNRVLEINPKTQKIVWRFGTGSDFAAGNTVVAPNDAERIPGGRTLIAGTGAPAGTKGYPQGGAIDSRVFIVNAQKKIVWQYGVAGLSGNGPNRLNAPVAAVYLRNGHVLITDQGNQRVIEVNKAKKIVWQYGTTNVPGLDANQLNNPSSAELLPNGHILIADKSGNRVIEVNRAKKIVWHYGLPDDSSALDGPAFASRLPSGNTLIADSLHSRVIEVTKSKKIVFNYPTNRRPRSVIGPSPTRAVRLANGSTLIANQFDNQVLIINRAKSIVYHYGKIAVPGKTHGFLNAPHSAYRIGDYTGLTRP